MDYALRDYLISAAYYQADCLYEPAWIINSFAEGKGLKILDWSEFSDRERAYPPSKNPYPFVLPDQKICNRFQVSPNDLDKVRSELADGLKQAHVAEIPDDSKLPDYKSFMNSNHLLDHLLAEKTNIYTQANRRFYAIIVSTILIGLVTKNPLGSLSFGTLAANFYSTYHNYQDIEKIKEDTRVSPELHKALKERYWEKYWEKTNSLLDGIKKIKLPGRCPAL